MDAYLDHSTSSASDKTAAASARISPIPPSIRSPLSTQSRLRAERAKAKAATSINTSNGMQPHNKRFHISFQLRGQEKAVPVAALAFKKIIHEEYLCKYLEELGVTPTAASLSTARSLLPVSALRISSGWKGDEVSVAPMNRSNIETPRKNERNNERRKRRQQGTQRKKMGNNQARSMSNSPSRSPARSPSHSRSHLHHRPKPPSHPSTRAASAALIHAQTSSKDAPSSSLNDVLSSVVSRQEKVFAALRAEVDAATRSEDHAAILLKRFWHRDALTRHGGDGDADANDAEVESNQLQLATGNNNHTRIGVEDEADMSESGSENDDEWEGGRKRERGSSANASAHGWDARIKRLAMQSTTSAIANLGTSSARMRRGMSPGLNAVSTAPPASWHSSSAPSSSASSSHPNGSRISLRHLSVFTCYHYLHAHSFHTMTRRHIVMAKGESSSLPSSSSTAAAAAPSIGTSIITANMSTIHGAEWHFSSSQQEFQILYSRAPLPDPIPPSMRRAHFHSPTPPPMSISSTPNSSTLNTDRSRTASPATIPSNPILFRAWSQLHQRPFSTPATMPSSRPSHRRPESGQPYEASAAAERSDVHRSSSPSRINELIRQHLECFPKWSVEVQRAAEEVQQRQKPKDKLAPYWEDYHNDNGISHDPTSASIATTLPNHVQSFYDASTFRHLCDRAMHLFTVAPSLSHSIEELIGLLGHACYWTYFDSILRTMHDYRSNEREKARIRRDTEANIDIGSDLPPLPQPLSADNRERLIVAIHALCTDIDTQLRRQPHYSLFFQPLLLDVIGSVLLHLFHVRYPRWFRGPRARQSDQDLLRLIDRLLDVHLLPPLPAGDRHANILEGCPNVDTAGLPAGHRARSLFFHTSSVVARMFPHAQSHGARRVRGHGGAWTREHAHTLQQRARSNHAADTVILNSARSVSVHEEKSMEKEKDRKVSRSFHASGAMTHRVRSTESAPSRAVDEVQQPQSSRYRAQCSQLNSCRVEASNVVTEPVINDVNIGGDASEGTNPSGQSSSIRSKHHQPPPLTIPSTSDPASLRPLPSAMHELSPSVSSSRPQLPSSSPHIIAPKSAGAIAHASSLPLSTSTQPNSNSHTPLSTWARAQLFQMGLNRIEHKRQ